VVGCVLISAEAIELAVNNHAGRFSAKLRRRLRRRPLQRAQRGAIHIVIADDHPGAVFLAQRVLAGVGELN
jgi:hypothetical protein